MSGKEREWDRTKAPEVFSKEPPSEAFERALEGFFKHGSCRSTCQACGREYVNPEGGWDFEDGELEGFELNAKKYPGWYIYVDYTVPVLDDVFGKSCVSGCACNWLAGIEQELWYLREAIIEYYKARVEEASKDVQRDQKLVEGL